MRLSDAIDQWKLSWRNLSTNSTKLYTYQSRKLHPLFERDVSSIGKLDLTGLASSMTAGSARGFITVSNVLWNWMVENEIASKNVVPKIQGSAEPTKPWSDDAIKAVLTSAPPHLRRIVWLSLVTAQRIGDILRIKKSDLFGTMLRVKQDKTGAELDITLDIETIKMIRSAPYDLVCSPDGKPISYKKFYNLANPIFRTHGVKGIHGLRVWHAISMGEDGASSRQIMVRLGHNSVRMSERYTTHMDRKKVEVGNERYTDSILQRIRVQRDSKGGGGVRH